MYQYLHILNIPFFVMGQDVPRLAQFQIFHHNSLILHRYVIKMVHLEENNINYTVYKIEVHLINRSGVVHRRNFGVLDFVNPGCSKFQFFFKLFVQNGSILCDLFHKYNYREVVLKNKNKMFYCTTTISPVLIFTAK